MSEAQTKLMAASASRALARVHDQATMPMRGDVSAGARARVDIQVDALATALFNYLYEELRHGA